MQFSMLIHMFLCRFKHSLRQRVARITCYPRLSRSFLLTIWVLAPGTGPHSSPRFLNKCSFGATFLTRTLAQATGTCRGSSVRLLRRVPHRSTALRAKHWGWGGTERGLSLRSILHAGPLVAYTLERGTGRFQARNRYTTSVPLVPMSSRLSLRLSLHPPCACAPAARGSRLPGEGHL